MLYHSYDVEIRKLQEQKLQLEIELIKYPENKKFYGEKINQIIKDISWFEKKISEGKGLGAHIV